MEWKTYRVMAQSTGGFIVEAQSEEHAEEMVIQHMFEMSQNGSPFRSGSPTIIEYSPDLWWVAGKEEPYTATIQFDGSGGDKVESIHEVEYLDCDGCPYSSVDKGKFRKVSTIMMPRGYYLFCRKCQQEDIPTVEYTRIGGR